MANRNEKKARKFAEDRGHDNQSITEAFVACLDMADWKAEQFKELVKSYIRLGYDSGHPVNLLEDLLFLSICIFVVNSMSNIQIHNILLYIFIFLDLLKFFTIFAMRFTIYNK